jgi:NADPH2:quinone reductase
MTLAVRIHRTGGPEELRLDEVAVSQPGPGEALVRHTAIGINYIDVYHRSGLYPLPVLPHALGVEAAGVVEAVGPGVDQVKQGERVAYVASNPGAYAEMRVMSAERLVTLPDSISDDAAAAMMLKGMTVEFLIRRAYPVKSGQTVLLHAAAGGVGLIACQWLRELGANVIGTVGSDAKAELARAHGCNHPIVYTRENFATVVRELTGGKGVSVVYDSVGKTTFEGSLDCLAPRGTLVVFGNASGKPAPFDVGVLAQKGSLFLTRPTLFTYIQSRAELLASAQALFEVVRSGRIAIRTAQRWPLGEAASAHRALESRATTGSSLLIP